jgi:threonine/homoserine/homoserine lactone efflux protein
MTLPDALLGFALVAGLLTIVPGLDTALVLRSVLTRGRAHAVATAAGIQVGVLVWGMAAAVGASALLAVSQVAFEVVRLAGAGYLVVLGVSLVVQAVRRRGVESAPPPARDGLLRAVATGALTNLLNPKVGVFYLATIPQFLPAGVSPLAMGLLLAGVHVLLGCGWFAALILAGSALGQRLRSPRVVRAVDGLTGGVLVAMGVRLALESPR